MLYNIIIKYIDAAARRASARANLDNAEACRSGYGKNC